MTKQITVEMDELQGVFDGIASQFEDIDYQPTLRASAGDLRDQYSEQFQTGTDPNGSPWAPLAESTIRRKGHGIILVETETLMNSLTRPGTEQVESRVGPVAGLLVHGTDTPYAIFHQRGTSRMPARPPVGVSEETLEKLTERTADSTVEGLK